LQEVDSLGVFDIMLELLKDDRTVSALVDAVITYGTPERLSKFKVIIGLLDRVEERDTKVAGEVISLLRELENDPLWDKLKSARFRSELAELVDILGLAIPLRPVIYEISRLLSDGDTGTRLTKLVEQIAALKPEDTEPVKGLRGLLRALGDPEVQKGLGYIFGLLKLLGKEAKPK